MKVNVPKDEASWPGVLRCDIWGYMIPFTVEVNVANAMMILDVLQYRSYLLTSDEKETRSTDKMQVEVAAQLLGQLSNAMLNEDWNTADELINPRYLTDVGDIRRSVNDVLKVAKLNLLSFEKNQFLSQQLKDAATTEVQIKVSNILKFTADLVHNKYPGNDEFDVYLMTLFSSKHEWLALAAIASASPCSSVKYDKLKDLMEENATDKVKFAYNDFIGRRVNCGSRNYGTSQQTSLMWK